MTKALKHVGRMTSCLVGLALMTNSTMALAAPISQEEKDKVNSYISAELAKEQFPIYLVLASGEVEGEEITAIRWEGGTQPGMDRDIQGYLDMTLNEPVINVAGEVLAAGYGALSDYEIQMALGVLTELTAKVNSQGLYTAEMGFSRTETGHLTLQVKVTPKEGTVGPVKSFAFQAEAEATEPGDLKMNLTAELNPQDTLMTDGRKSLYMIFKALLEEREPTTEEAAGLVRVIDAIGGFVGPEGAPEGK